ncbi:MAG: hypothetical protein WC556_04160 [Candidatus Methanoperedens sp.]
MAERKYIIESKRYIDGEGKTAFEQWITSSNVIEIKHSEQYRIFSTRG